MRALNSFFLAIAIVNSSYAMQQPAPSAGALIDEVQQKKQEFEKQRLAWVANIIQLQTRQDLAKEDLATADSFHSAAHHKATLEAQIRNFDFYIRQNKEEICQLAYQEYTFLTAKNPPPQ